MGNFVRIMLNFYVRYVFFSFLSLLLVNSRVTYSIEVRGDDLVTIFEQLTRMKVNPKKFS